MGEYQLIPKFGLLQGLQNPYSLLLNVASIEHNEEEVLRKN